MLPGKTIEETLKGPYKVAGVSEDTATICRLERSEDNLQWMTREPLIVKLERLTPVSLEFEKFKAEWESLTNKESVQAIWHKDSPDMTLSVHGPRINKSSELRTREFGPLLQS